MVIAVIVITVMVIVVMVIVVMVITVMVISIHATLFILVTILAPPDLLCMSAITSQCLRFNLD